MNVITGKEEIYMKDSRTLAFINLYAILGNLSRLCELVPEARKLIENENVSLGIQVKNGPAATLCFNNGVCTIEDGVDNCNIKLPFSSPEKFNGMIDGTVKPFPSKGFTKIGFLLNTFTKLTDILPKYLKASEEDLKNEEFFKTSTILMLHVIAEAIAQIGNEDKVGKASASYIDDGIAKLGIGDELGVGIEVKDHRLKVIHTMPDKYLSYMRFNDISLARDLFDGKVNAVAAVGLGQVRIGGMISQIDNINRILDRVALYLA